MSRRGTWHRQVRHAVMRQTTRHAFADALQAAARPPLRWHDLRAAHGGLLLAAGVDISVISKMLGHSSVALTVRHYAGVGEALGRQASERFAALFDPAIMGNL
jgi:site-specific recombinase XerD